MQGPLGKGLEIKPTGTHIAFTAGTGCLVFVDLVAHLIRKNLKLLNKEEAMMIDGDDFKFVLFASFCRREEAIALQLCEGLRDICSKYGKNNFEFHLRLSNESKERWDYGFIGKKLEAYK